MTRDEAINICKAIHAMKPREGFENPTKREIYVNGLIDLNYNIAMQALQDCFNTKTFAPEIPEIREAYLSILRKAKREDFYKSNCEICEGYGFLLYKKIIDELVYDFLAFCECNAGDRWKVMGATHSAIRYDEALPKEFYKRNKDETYDLTSISDVIKKMKRGMT